MTAVQLSPRFREDVEQAVDWYLVEAGAAVAERFVAAVESAVRLVASRPGFGSRHLAGLIGIPTLRSRPVERFPYLILYLPRGDDMVLLRLPHGNRDVPPTIGADE